MIYYLLNKVVLLKKIRSAVIGCGRIGCGFDDTDNKMIRTHAGSYFKNNETELIALCDIDKQKLKKYGKKYGIKNLYTNTETMFKNEKPEIISICTLVETHLMIVKQAAKYGIKGIFLEKPASDSLGNMKKILTICKKNNISLQVDHQRRFSPFYHSIKKFLFEKKLGEIQYSIVYYGAGIANTGTHIFDLLRLFFGDVKAIQAKKSSNKSKFSHDPNLDVKIEFTNNITTNMIGMDLNHYGICEIDIFGTLGRIRINLINDKIEYFKSSSSHPLSYKNLNSTKINIKNTEKSSIMLGLQNLVDNIKKDSPLLSSGEDGYKALELIISSIKSSNTKKKYQFPLKDNSYKIKSK